MLLLRLPELLVSHGSIVFCTPWIHRWVSNNCRYACLAHFLKDGGISVTFHEARRWSVQSNYFRGWHCWRMFCLRPEWIFDQSVIAGASEAREMLTLAGRSTAIQNLSFLYFQMLHSIIARLCNPSALHRSKQLNNHYVKDSDWVAHDLYRVRYCPTVLCIKAVHEKVPGVFNYGST